MIHVLKVHDYNYLSRVIEQAKSLEFNNPTGIVKLDRDTDISKFTWDASLLSCGSVIKAVDSVMNGEASNAFCAVRPPGHHAGVFGTTM